MKFNALSRLSTATIIFLSLATLTSIVRASESAADAGTTPPCGGSLVSVCCASVDGPYPRGYVGGESLPFAQIFQDADFLTRNLTEDCTAAPTYGSCPIARPTHICCQKLYDVRISQQINEKEVAEA